MTLFRADDFPTDWYGYATNQAGHAMLVGFPLALLALTFLPPVWVPPVVALAYGVIWEWMIQRGGDWKDSLEDTAHVMVGASVPATGIHYTTDFWACWTTFAACFGGWAAVLLIGVVRRGAGLFKDWTL